MKVVQKKVCLLGEFSVGKTSLVRQFVEGQFDDKYLSTIGVKISRKSIEREYGQFNMLLWDLAGGDKYVGNTANYLKGASGAIVVCDLTRQETLIGLHEYANQIRKVNPEVQIVLVGNKVDLVDERVILDADLAEVAFSLDASYFCTSAKTGEQVGLMFTALASLIEGEAK
jgi:small GTP-binding protein